MGRDVGPKPGHQRVGDTEIRVQHAANGRTDQLDHDGAPARKTDGASRTHPAAPSELVEVALLWYPGALLTSLTLAQEMLAAANSVLRAQRRGPAWRTMLWAPEPNRAEGSGDGLDAITRSTERADGADVGRALGLPRLCSWSSAEARRLVVVPACWGNPQPLLKRSAPLIDQMVAVRGETVWIGVGSGAFMLGEAGLLDGRAATTHWSQLDRFAERYPHAILRRDHRIVESTDVFTVASLNALADLIVYLVSRQVGEDVGRTIERHFSYESRNPFAEEVFSDRTPHNVADELVAEAQSFIHENLTESFDVDELAGRLRVSRRTLDRRFREATGRSIVQYRNRARIELGAEMLRGTDLAVGEVAARCGMQDGRYFARVFREVLGLSPREYRRVVRAKLFRRE